LLKKENRQVSNLELPHETNKFQSTK